MTFRKLIPVAAALAIAAGFAQSASAVVLFSTRGLGVGDPENFISEPFGGALLEDATLNGTGPFNVTGLTLGYYNEAVGVTNVEALISFYDTVNYNANAPASIISSQLGSSYRLSILAAPGVIGETSFVLPGGGITVPDNTLGMTILFVNPGTNTMNTSVQPVFHGPTVSLGSSNHRFGDDGFDPSGTFIGLQPPYEVVGGDTLGGDVNSFGVGDLYANLYFELQGEAVPEPGSLALLGLGGLALVRRRRA